MPHKTYYLNVVYKMCNNSKYDYSNIYNISKSTIDWIIHVENLLFFIDPIYDE